MKPILISKVYKKTTRGKEKTTKRKVGNENSVTKPGVSSKNRWRYNEIGIGILPPQSLGIWRYMQDGM